MNDTYIKIKLHLKRNVIPKNIYNFIWTEIYIHWLIKIK